MKRIFTLLYVVLVFSTAGLAQQVTGLTFAPVGGSATSLKISWTSGTGVGRIIVVKDAAGVFDVATISNNTTNIATLGANSDYSAATDKDGGTGVVKIVAAISGAGTNVTVTNLVAGTTYYVQAYEFTNTAANPTYNLTTSATNPKGVVFYTATGSFTVPNDITTVSVQAWGGGGGGGRDSGAGNGAAGGGGGAFASGTATVAFGVNPTVTVGAGGLGGINGSADGTVGTSSSFGAAVIALGGGVTNTGATGAAGGSGAGSTGNGTKNNGGSGGNGGIATGNGGGGGGSSGSVSGAGVNGGNFSGGTGGAIGDGPDGDGGIGGNASGQQATAGAFPGGGGGGRGDGNGNSGDGADGLVIVTFSDQIAPVFTSTAPAASSFVNTTKVSYTLSEPITSGTITWTHTGGVADGNHTQALAGTELTAGAHTNITLTNNPTLVDGAVYTVSFNGIDASNNAATTVNSTLVTYDVSSPAAFTVGATASTGGTVVSGFYNSTNTGITVDVPIANDASLNGGTVQLLIDNQAAGGFINLGSTSAISSVNTTKTVAISSATLTGSSRYADGNTLSFKAIITDAAGNQTMGTVSVSTLVVDVSGPAAFTAGTVSTNAGGTVVAGYYNISNHTNTAGITVAVPVANDAGLSSGTIQIQVSNNGSGGTYINLGTAVAVAAINTTQNVVISDAVLIANAKYGDGNTLNFKAIITENVGNPTTSSASASTLIIDQTPPAAFTVGTNTTNVGGTVVNGYYNATNVANTAGITVNIPIANDATLNGGSAQITVDNQAAGGFVNLGSSSAIAAINTTKGVNITDASLMGSAKYADGNTLSFKAVITDVAGNPTTGTVSASTCIIDLTAPAAFTVGSTASTGGTVVAGFYNSSNTGITVDVPIANDASLSGGTVQLQIDNQAAGGFINLGSTSAIAAINATKTVAISSATLTGNGRYANGNTLSFKAIINDVAGNATTGTVSASTLIADTSAPSAFTAGTVSTNAGGTVVAGYYNISNQANTAGITVAVPVANDASLSSGTIQIQVSNNGSGGTYINLGTAVAVSAINTTQNVVISDAVLTANAKYGNGNTLNFKAVLTDNAGNTTTSSASASTLIIDQTAPAALTVGSLTTTGGTVVAAYWNLSNTGMNVVVPLTAGDGTLDGGTVQIQIQNTTTNVWVNVASSGLSTITNGQRTGGTKTVAITAADLEAAVSGADGFKEGLVGGASGSETQFLQVRAIVSDAAGNGTNWTKSATNIDVDQTPPSVTSASFSASFVRTSDPSFTTCNGTAIAAGSGGDSNKEMVHLTISEPLNLADGTTIPVVPTGGLGFNSSTGSFSTCSNRGGTAYHPTNIIHLKSNNDGDWTSATTYSFTPGGTVVKDAAGNEMGAFAGLNPADTDPPDLATGLVFNANGSGPETITFKFDGPLNAAVTNTVTGFTTSVGTIAGGANYNSATQTVTLTSTANGMWTDAVTLSYNQATGNVTDAANNELVAFGGAAPAPAEPIFLTSVHIQSNNGTNTAFATTGNTITLTFNVARTLVSTPVVDFYGVTPATTVTGPVGSTYTATLLMTGAMTEGVVPFSILADEAIKSTTTTATTDSPTGSTVTFDKTAPTVTPITVASNNANPVYAKVGDVVTVSYTATDNLGTISVSPATIDGLAASTVTATTATLTTTASDNNGVMPFSITFKDQAGNSSVKTATTNASTVTFDKAPPVVASIATSSTLKGIGITNGIVATSVSFLVTFTETNTPLTGIDPTDFTVGTTGTVTFSSPVVVAVTSATTRTVTINGINGYGKISLGLTDDNTILDAASNPLAGAADGSVPTSFTGAQYYNIVLPEPAVEAITVNSTTVTSNSITLTWNGTATVQVPTHFLVLAKTTTAGSYPSVADGTYVNDGALAQNVPYVLGTNTFTFNGLNSGTSYDFIVYKYTLNANNSNDNIDFEITTPGIKNGVPTNTAALTTIALNSSPVSISSIKNASGNSVDVMQFTIFDDGQDPLVPNVMTLHLNDVSQETITFTLREGLTLADGASVTGFTSSTGAVVSAIYSAATSMITLTNGGNGTWNSATKISYSPGPGNVKFLTLGNMLAIDSHAVVQVSDAIPVTFSSNGTFVVPVGVTSIQVEAWGGGGSGGGYNSLVFGGGGGGGAYSRRFLAVTPGSSFPVVVGFGATCCSGDGQPGNPSNFGSGLVVAAGGGGGIAGDGGGAGGAGGSAASGIGTVRFNGGFGANGSGGAGGGGGSSAGTNASGNAGASNGAPGIAPPGGGNGGAGVPSGSAQNGFIPGGGGGGTSTPGSGSFGGNGQIKITYSNLVGGGTSDWAADNSPTKFSQLVITQGSGNDAAFTDWRNIIAGAELSDGTNTVTGVINPTDGSDITFTTIVNPSPTAATDVGFITDATAVASPKTYTLKVWLKTNLSSALAATVDGLNLAFKVDPAQFIYDDVTNSAQKSSRFVATQPVLHSGTEPVTVEATQLDFSTSPIDPQLVLTNVTSVAAPLPLDNSTVPVVRARDLHGNTDLDYNAPITISANTPAVLPTSFTMSNGRANLTSLQYQDSGNGQLTAHTTTVAANSIVPSDGLSSAVTVNYSNTSTMVSSGAAGVPAASGTTPISTVNFYIPNQSYAIPYAFSITDDGGAGGDGSPTRISQIKITKKASANPIPDWRDILDSSNPTYGAAFLYDGSSFILATVNQNDITISNMLPTSTTSDLGYIDDNATKTYQLYIFLKPTMTGGLPPIVDHLNFDFEVNPAPTNIGLLPQSSLILPAQPIINSGPIDVDVAATELVFTTLPPADVLVNANLSVSPVVEAHDVLGNLDLDYSPSSGIVVTNAGGLGMVNPPTSFSSGVLTFPPTFRYTQIGNGTPTVSSSTLAIGESTAPTFAVSATTVTVRVGNASTITAGALAEPTTISSLIDLTHTPAGKKVFDFAINDDPGGTPVSEDDGNPTRISSITITQGTGNTITDWSQVFSQVQLDDGTGNSGFGTISATQLVFGSGTGLPNTLSTDPGYIGDGSSKTYTLTVWLKTNLSGTQNYPTTIDGLNFVFEVLQGNIGLNVNGTKIKTGENQNSGTETAAVVATQLDVTTPNAASFVSINTPFSPVLQARDVNGNRDLSFNGATGTITAFTNASGATMTGGPTVGVTQFTNGLLTPTFQFTSGANNDIVTLSISAGVGPINTVISPVLTLKTSTITAGALVEPLIISSLATTAAGTNVFDFKINDDDNQASGTDGKPTKVSTIVITQLGVGNDIADWTQLIASATLKNSVTGGTRPGTVNVTDITFSGIPNSVAADFGYIGEASSTTYTLNIVLRSSLGGSLPSTVDNLNLAFEVLASNLILGPSSSTFSTSGTSNNVNSGATKNAIDVIATKLSWTQSPLSSLLVSKDISAQLPATVPVIEALDADNNRDLDFVTSLNITNAGTLPMSSVTGLQTNVTSYTLPVNSIAPQSGGIYTFPGDFQFTDVGNGATGNGTMTANTSGLTLAISNPTTVHVGLATTITAGAVAEPPTISSLVNNTLAAGAQVFDFKVTDDDGLAPSDPQNDGNPTRIMSITIKQGTNNSVADWSQAFAQVKLSDGTLSYIGAINSTSLVFDGASIPYVNAAPGDFGYIGDNTSKTYTLTVWLKTALGGTLPIDIDGKIFEFTVDATASSIVTDPHGTSIIPTENEDSGPAKNVVTVVATQLDITTPSSATSASLNSPLAPIIAESRDVNGNRDLGFNGIITAFTKTTPADSTINRPTVGVSAFTNGAYTFPSTFTFITGANGDNVTLRLRADNTGGNSGVTCGVNAICSGISPTITLLSSFESFITKDPTFTIPATIPYVTHQETNGNLTGSSYELIRVLLLDGSRSSSATYGGLPLQFQTQTDTDGQLHGDLDGASTNLASITIQISNPSNLRTIGLFDKNGVQLGSQIDVAALALTSGAAPHNFVFTGSPILIAAADDSSAVFSVRASFNNTSITVKDGDDIQIQLFSASLVSNSGSSFYNGSSPANSGTGGPYTGGQVPGGSKSLGLIDVVATSLDFTTQPSTNAGINEPMGINPLTGFPYPNQGNATSPLPSTISPVVKARDKFKLIDLDFNFTPAVTDIAGGGTIIYPNTFVNGVFNLNGLIYPKAGDGTLTVIANGINSSTPVVNATGTITASTGSTTVTGVGTLFTMDLAVNDTIRNSSGVFIGKVASIANNTSLTLTLNAKVAVTGGTYIANSIPCQHVDVVNVVASLATITTPPNLKGGTPGATILGVTFTPDYSTTTQPSLKRFTFSFDFPYQTATTTIFKNFKVLKGAVPVTGTGGATVTTKSSTNDTNLDLVVVDWGTNTPIPLYDPNNGNAVSATFYLVADVDVTAKLGTQNLTPQLIDGGYGSQTDDYIVTTKGSASANVIGQKYSFASTRPPLLLTDQNSLTYPYNGQLNVEQSLTQIDLEFDIDVWSLDGVAELHNRKDNTLVANLVAINGDYRTQQGLTPTANPISFAINFVNGHSLKPDTLYYVTIKQGSFDNLAGTGTGISDDGFNYFGGISSNSVLYFKISSLNPPNLIDATSEFSNLTTGVFSTTFDQRGTGYYLVLDHAQYVANGSNVPTVNDIFEPTVTNYASNNPGSVVTWDQYDITNINSPQSVEFPASLNAGTTYDVWVYAQNDAQPSPVAALFPYGDANTLPAPYKIGGAGPTFNFTTPTASQLQDSYSPQYQLCPDSYFTLTKPIIIGESNPWDFDMGSTVQDFNLLLPPGYTFDGVTLPTVRLEGPDFDQSSLTVDWVNNTLVNISYVNSGSIDIDKIIITNLKILGPVGTVPGTIKRFAGNNALIGFSNNLASISNLSVSTQKFTNSYTIDNDFTPFGFTSTDIITAIPDNYVDIDRSIGGDIRLIPAIVPSYDYGITSFSGNGVTNDLLSLGSASLGSAFDITMTHTDLNGCISNNKAQYVVYDHTSPISKKLGLGGAQNGSQQDLYNPSYPLPIAGNFPSPVPVPVAQNVNLPRINYKDVAGYKLLGLQANIAVNASSQIMLGPDWQAQVSKIPVVVNQITNDTDIPIALGFTAYNEYQWDYTHILNAASESKIANPATTITKDPYDNFKFANSSNNYYWTGGSLGNVEFTGTFQNTADLTVIVPFKQNVELFVPAIPLIEVGSSNGASYDITDGTVNTKNSQSAFNFINTNFGIQYATNGYKGTSVFCEKGGIITLNGFPAALAGTSTGTFAVYDFQSYDFASSFISRTGIITTQTSSTVVTGIGTKFTTELTVGAVLMKVDGTIIGTVQTIIDNLHLILKAAPTTGISGASYKANLNIPLVASTTVGPFIDNGNGSMTLDPSGVKNNYNDILVSYTYRGNTSPAPGTGYLILRVTPNPVAQFTIASLVAASGAKGSSASNAFCVGSNITFDATVAQSYMQSNQQPSQAGSTNSIKNYSWDFGDQNSGPANIVSGPSALLATHTYNVSTVYTVNLSLLSNWQCASLPSIVAPTPSTNPVLYAGSGGNITVGNNPTPIFSVSKNCVGDQITFDASGSSVVGNSTISNYNWDYNYQTPANGLPNPNPALASLTSAVGAKTKYSKSGFYNVLLTTITTLGCQQSTTITISQLDVVSAFNNNFDTDDGGWQAVDLSQGTPLPSTDPATKTSWIWNNTSGKINPEFDSPASNKLWSTSGQFYQKENSALYSACLDINVPRPMIAFSSYVDVNTGDGLVLQYSTDDFNILDPNKTWTNLGTTPTATKARPGIDWFNAVGQPALSAASPYNSNGTGWTGNGKHWIHPKHSLDTLSGQSRVILRFAYSSLSSTNNTDGVAIDSVFFGSRTRTILFENFTTTDAGGNTALNSDLSTDASSITAFVQKTISQTQLVNINYHVGFIGMDPFNLDNPADPSSRALYYNVNKVPYAFLDGIHYQDNSKTPPSDLFKDWGQAEYDLNTLQLAKADFLDATTPGSKPTAVTANSDGSLQVDVNFTPVFDLPFGVRGGTVLQVAILEKAITTLPTNGKITTGETSFGYVLKKMLPNAAGTKFTNPIKAGVPVSAGSFKWIPDKAILHNSPLTMVVFLQNEDTKEVYQAFIQDDIPPPPVVTGIEPITADNIKVYPNPADQEFTIELPSPAQQSMRVTMANQLGQFTEVGAIGEGEQSKKISTQGLTEGVYILQLGSNGNALRTKVVVLHK